MKKNYLLAIILLTNCWLFSQAVLTPNEHFGTPIDAHDYLLTQNKTIKLRFHFIADDNNERNFTYPLGNDYVDAVLVKLNEFWNQEISVNTSRGAIPATLPFKIDFILEPSVGDPLDPDGDGVYYHNSTKFWADETAYQNENDDLFQSYLSEDVIDVVYKEKLADWEDGAISFGTSGYASPSYVCKYSAYDSYLNNGLTSAVYWNTQVLGHEIGHTMGLWDHEHGGSGPNSPTNNYGCIQYSIGDLPWSGEGSSNNIMTSTAHKKALYPGQVFEIHNDLLNAPYLIREDRVNVSCLQTGEDIKSVIVNIDNNPHISIWADNTVLTKGDFYWKLIIDGEAKYYVDEYLNLSLLNIANKSIEVYLYKYYKNCILTSQTTLTKQNIGICNTNNQNFNFVFSSDNFFLNKIEVSNQINGKWELDINPFFKEGNYFALNYEPIYINQQRLTEVQSKIGIKYTAILPTTKPGYCYLDTQLRIPVNLASNLPDCPSLPICKLGGNSTIYIDEINADRFILNQDNSIYEDFDLLSNDVDVIAYVEKVVVSGTPNENGIAPRELQITQQINQSEGQYDMSENDPSPFSDGVSPYVFGLVINKLDNCVIHDTIIGGSKIFESAFEYENTLWSSSYEKSLNELTITYSVGGIDDIGYSYFNSNNLNEMIPTSQIIDVTTYDDGAGTIYTSNDVTVIFDITNIYLCNEDVIYLIDKTELNKTCTEDWNRRKQKIPLTDLHACGTSPNFNDDDIIIKDISPNPTRTGERVTLTVKSTKDQVVNLNITDMYGLVVYRQANIRLTEGENRIQFATPRNGNKQLNVVLNSNKSSVSKLLIRR